MRRLVAGLLIVATVSVALSGCSRFGQDERTSDSPSPAVSTPASATTGDTGSGDVLAELDAVDDAVTQADRDALAADDAAHTDDTP